MIENTPLTFAVSNNNEEIVKLLLQHSELDVNTKSVFRKWKWVSDENRRYGKETTNEEEKTPLYSAVENENIDIINLLISNAKIDINDHSLIKTSYIDTEKHVWKTWISNFIEKTALQEACEKSNFNIVKLLVSKSDIKINEKSIRMKIHTNYESDHDVDCYQIHNWKIEERRKEIEKSYEKDIASKYDADSYSKSTNYDENTALDVAVRKKNQKIINFLRNNKGIEISTKSEEEREREEREEMIQENMKDQCNIC